MVDAATPEGATPDGIETTATAVLEETKDLGDGGKAALEAERRARRDAEKQAKTANAELQKLREANMNEVDKAVSQARDEGRAEARREAGIGRVEDAIRAAAGGRQVDIDALLDGVDRTKFLDADGAPDREAITAWIDRIAPAEQERGDGFPTVPNLGQGTRSTAPALGSDPLTQSLKNMLGVT